MCSLCVLCFIVGYLIINTGLVSGCGFECDTDCKCHEHGNSPSKNLSCTSSNTKLQGFSDVCDKWFLEGFNYTLISEDKGIIEIAIHFSRYFNQKLDFSVTLLYEDENNKAHSKQKVKIKKIPQEECTKAAKVSFKYVFSGYYKLHLFILRESCLSQTFEVVTAYKQQPIKLISNLEVLPRYPRKTLELTIVDKVINSIDRIRLAILYKKNDVTRFETFITHINKGNCCVSISWKIQPPTYVTCSCKWIDNIVLKCNYEVDPNDYYVTILYSDPRCEKNTLWTISGTSCFWTLSVPNLIWSTDKDNFTSSNFTENISMSTESQIFMTNEIWILTSLSLFGTLLVIFGFIMSRHKRNSPVPIILYDNRDNYFLSHKKTKVLLLYPRDCDAFMTVMKRFRKLLETSCQVYDPWDENLFNEVAQSIETWSLPLIVNEEIKIVVVLSECAMILEQAYFGTICVNYKNPTVLDKIFGQSLKAIYEYFSTRSDSYQRVFIVRFDEKLEKNLSYHLNCATLYTIPHTLMNLLVDLTEDSSTNINQRSLAWLTSEIKKYQSFKETFKDYMDELIQ